MRYLPWCSSRPGSRSGPSAIPDTLRRLAGGDVHDEMNSAMKAGRDHGSGVAGLAHSAGRTGLWCAATVTRVLLAGLVRLRRQRGQ